MTIDLEMSKDLSAALFNPGVSSLFRELGGLAVLPLYAGRVRRLLDFLECFEEGSKDPAADIPL